MDELAVIEVNKILSLCDTYLLTDGELNYLNEIGQNPQSTCEYYDTAQITLDRRARTDTTINAALDALKAFATVDGCMITLAPEVIPDVDVPMLGGAL